MSLSSLLLSNKSAKVDSELDSMFNIAPKKLPANAIPAQAGPIPKRKLDSESEHGSSSRLKKMKAASTTHDAADNLQVDEEPESDHDEEYSGIHSEGESEEGSDLVHETLKPGNGSRALKSKSKFVPPEESKEQRDLRTIFIGNLPIGVAQKKPLGKQLRRHILSHVPGAKIESIRFRSVPFQTPTTALPDETEDVKGKKKDKFSGNSREHDRERASSWKAKKLGHDADTEPTADEKKFLTPHEKKKIAFIKQDFHSAADTVHAYIVFAHPTPAATRPSNLPPSPPTIDPFEAARIAAQNCDGTLFMDRMLRVDVVGKNHDANTPQSNIDPKLCVFVGNLEFATKEEDLRIFFEQLVTSERGAPSAGDTASSQGDSWVTRVRIVRDKDTQLGKGFAYVQFRDRECVDEVLSLEQEKLKFAKRKLRVQRCKPTISSKNRNHDTTRQRRNTNTDSKKAPSHVVSSSGVGLQVPRGDPLLGERLVKLSKEERKQVKASDADRVARRLAKKKARMALAAQGVKPQRNQRTRDRKAASSGSVKTVSSKARRRSDRSVAQKNTKK